MQWGCMDWAGLLLHVIDHLCMGCYRASRKHVCGGRSTLSSQYFNMRRHVGPDVTWIDRNDSYGASFPEETMETSTGNLLIHFFMAKINNQYFHSKLNTISKQYLWSMRYIFYNSTIFSTMCNLYIVVVNYVFLWLFIMESRSMHCSSNSVGSSTHLESLGSINIGLKSWPFKIYGSPSR